MEKIYIYGKHVITEALRSAPKAIKTVFLASHVDDRGLKETIRGAGIRIEELSPKILRFIGTTALHQGVVALIAADDLVMSYNDFVKTLSVTDHLSLVLLDEIQDPQNVGAIIRSAAAFGVSGILIPPHNQSPITGTVVKVSSGMAFRVPLVGIGNVNETIRDLKKRGFWVYGLDGDAEKSIHDEKFDAPSVFVLGNEANGIRQKTKELCDVLLRIPTNKNCESLNVSASAAVALYVWSSQNQNKL